MSNTLEQIINIINNSLEEKIELNERTEIESLGLDSVCYIQIIVQIEECFNIEFDVADMAENRFNTLQDLAVRVQNLLSVCNN